VLFWKDFWSHDQLLCDKFPRLFSYVLDEDCSVASVISEENFSSCFALPLSVEAYEEMQQVSELLAHTHVDQARTDHRKFVWGDKYTPSKFYNFLFEGIPQDRTLNAIWDSRALPKLKVFLWLLLIDRLNTYDIMNRKNWNIDSGPECVLCAANVLETRSHLFFECDFARHCWNLIGIQWPVGQNLSNVVCLAKTSFQGPSFMEIFGCAAWNIWKIRNERIFQARQPSINRWKVGFQHDVMLHRYKVKSAFVQPLIDWLVSIFV
jgi:hypothetical protein